MTDAKLMKNGAKAAKDGPVTLTGNYSFAGIEDKYFVAAFLPGKRHVRQTVADRLPSRLSAITRPPHAKPRHCLSRASRSATARQPVFALRRPQGYRYPAHGQSQAGAGGGFRMAQHSGQAAVPDRELGRRSALIHNYGWSIILVTIALNFVLFPLKITSMKSMKKMQALQPQIAAINDKYKNIGLRDPQKADQNQEVMELYKKHGVNPMGGCIPCCCRFRSSSRFIRCSRSRWRCAAPPGCGSPIFPSPKRCAIHILPIIMVVSQFVMQKMTPTTTGGDPSQQKMMQFMPLIFGFMFYNFVERAGIILFDQQPGGRRAAVVLQQDVAGHRGRTVGAAAEKEKGWQEIDGESSQVFGIVGRSPHRAVPGPCLDSAGFRMGYEMADGDATDDDFETPDVVVKFSGPDVEYLLANRAELLLALEHVTMEALRMPSEDHSRISFDANDYRLLRIEELRMSAGRRPRK